MKLMKIAALASHGGSNLQSIIDAAQGGAIPVEITLVISNNSSSKALERARKAEISALHISSHTHPEPGADDAAMLEALKQSGAELVVLAGYMKKIGPQVLEAYRGRILNIHPALLPRHGGPGMYGIHPHEAALAAGDSESGPTVHLVDEHYDQGPILAQRPVPIEPGDTPETLQQRVLAQEHLLYPEVIGAIARGEIDLTPYR